RERFYFLKPCLKVCLSFYLFPVGRRKISAVQELKYFPDSERNSRCFLQSFRRYLPPERVPAQLLLLKLQCFQNFSRVFSQRFHLRALFQCRKVLFQKELSSIFQFRQ